MPINWSVLDPNTPERIGNSFYAGQQEALRNQLAQQQMQHAATANALQQYQLSSAQRQDQEQNALRQLFAGAKDMNDPNLVRSIYGISPEKGIAYEKAAQERKNTQLKMAVEALKIKKDAATQVMANPTPENAMAALQQYAQASGADVSQEVAKVQSFGGNPEAIRQWAAGHAVDADKMLPKLTGFGLGNVYRNQAQDPLTGKVLGATDTPMGMSPNEQAMLPIHQAQVGVAQQNAATSRGQLGVAQARLAAELSPEIQGQLAGAKETAKTKAETTVKAEAVLPQVVDTAKQAIKTIDELVGSGKAKPHPGFEGAVGATWKPGMRFVPGSSEADFMRRLDQIKGGAFLQAYETLKGGGQITEIEGKKATDAITRMDTAQSEKEFIQAARDYQDVIRKGVERAEKKAGKPVSGGWKIEKE